MTTQPKTDPKKSRRHRHKSSRPKSRWQRVLQLLSVKNWKRIYTNTLQRIPLNNPLALLTRRGKHKRKTSGSQKTRIRKWLPARLQRLKLILSRFGKSTRTMLRSWWKSASFWHAIRGIPTVVVAVLAMTMIMLIKSNPEGSLANRYSQAAESAIRAGDHEAAAVYYERLIELAGRRPETIFRLAVSEHELGNHQRVGMLLEEIAPRDNAVYAPAHLWRAKQILSQLPLDQTKSDEAEAQLLQTVQLHRGNVDANELLGNIYLQRNDYTKAARHLNIASDERPELHLLVARALVLQGNSSQAQGRAELAKELFQAKLDEDINDVHSRIQLALLMSFLEEFQDAIDLLLEGTRLSDTPELRQTMAGVLIAWSDSVGRKDPGAVDRQVSLLEKGLEVDPSQMFLFFRMMKLLIPDDENSDQTRARLHDMLTSGKSPRIVHLVLGTDAGERGDYDQAMFHLDRAYKLDKNSGVVANNLAWYLTIKDPPELERAFGLINALANEFPNVAAYRDTRGHVLVRQGKWKEALDDLEYAVQTYSNSARTHAALAQAYRGLGLESLAKSHEEKAKMGK